MSESRFRPERIQGGGMHTRPSSRFSMDISTIDASIQSEVARIGTRLLGCFQTAGCFVFIEDPYSHFLEPAYTSKDLPYETLDAVSTSYGPRDQSQEFPNKITDAGIASVGNQ